LPTPFPPAGLPSLGAHQSKCGSGATSQPGLARMSSPRSRSSPCCRRGAAANSPPALPGLGGAAVKWLGPSNSMATWKPRQGTLGARGAGRGLRAGRGGGSARGGAGVAQGRGEAGKAELSSTAAGRSSRSGHGARRAAALATGPGRPSHPSSPPNTHHNVCNDPAVGRRLLQPRAAHARALQRGRRRALTHRRAARRRAAGVPRGEAMAQPRGRERRRRLARGARGDFGDPLDLWAGGPWGRAKVFDGMPCLQGF
jgi:hypothetical protein